MKRHHALVLAPVFAIVLSCTGASIPAHAAFPAGGDLYALGSPVPVTELADQRGGFADPSGHLFRFAVDVRAQIDGTLDFVRSLVISPDQNGQLQSASSHNLQTLNLPNGSSANVVNNGTGVLFQTADGRRTLLFSQSASGMPQSFISNTVNGLNIGQTVNMDVVLQNMQGVLSQINVSRANDVQQNVIQTLHDTQSLAGF